MDWLRWLTTGVGLAPAATSLVAPATVDVATPHTSGTQVEGDGSATMEGNECAPASKRDSSSGALMVELGCHRVAVSDTNGKAEPSALCRHTDIDDDWLLVLHGTFDTTR